jgi:hypothetical protein
MIIKLSDNNFIKASNVDEIRIDTRHDCIIVNSYKGGITKVFPENGKTIFELAKSIIDQLNNKPKVESNENESRWVRYLKNL